MSLTSEQYENKIKELEREIEELKKKQTVQMKRQQYGLTWIDVPEAFDKESENKIPVLEEVKEKAITNDDGKPTHILIEGDNYHALQCLNYTHKGEIDVIYIDPPYNTGKGFIYKDKRILDRYPDGTDVPLNSPLRHSYWLSFISKRLIVSKNLLSQYGIIYISIDDNELANLKLLCDSVFGEKNFIGIIVQNKCNAQNDAKNIQKNHDYVLVYAKNRKYDGTVEQHIICNDKYEKKELQIDSDGNFYYKGAGIVTGGEGGTLNARNNLGWTIYYNPNTLEKKAIADYDLELAKTSNNESEVYKDDEKLLKQGFIIIRPPKKGNKLGCWTWSIEKFNSESSFILITKSNNGYSVSKKEIVSKELVYKEGEKYYFDKYNLVNIKSIYDFPSANGSTVLSDILGNKAFDNPKNLELLQFLIQSIHNKNSIILDFFAGSGTTMHATMKLNEEDGGTRQCILVQASENNICEEVTYERNKRVIQGYTNPKGEKVPGLGNSLKYYKTAFVGEHDATNATDDDCVTLAKKAGCLLSLGENTLDEIETTDFFQIYNNKNSKISTAIYFTEELSHFDDFVESVKTVAQNHKTVIVYIFSWSSSEDFIYEFEEIPNVQIKAIPQPILEIYKSIYQK